MRGGERRHTRRPLRRRLRVFIIYMEIAALLLLGILLGSIAGAFYSLSKTLPSGLDVAEYTPTEATKIISSDGVVLAEVFEENREVVDISDIPLDLQHATVAIEDSRFYHHVGVDVRGIGRAVVENLRKGRISQGGSTLTQQLARNVYLTREKKLSRKLQEVILALKIERNYSKEQILWLYLNQVYYGSGAYGVQTAANIYFGKQVKDLTLAECAMLAGLPQKPSGFNPHENLSGALTRRNVVLSRMEELGYITKSQCDSARKERPKLAELKPKGIAKYKAPWFVTYVIKEVTKELGPDQVYRGGLRIHTTLNYEMQETAERAVREGVARARSGNASQAALVSIDPHNGFIKAMVGSANPDFTRDQFNRAVQAKRQPGSSFKAFVYTAAIDNGYDANYRVSNARITFRAAGSEPWSPKNYDGRYGGTYTLTRAVANSVNVVAVRVAEKVGIDEVVKYARLCGITSDLPRNLSLALGSAVVSPLELTSAYGVFAARGVRAEPMCVVKITDRDGSIIKENTPQTAQVLSQQTADTMSEMFRAVVTQGTGRRLTYGQYYIPDAHGKTGTTNDDRDAWFLGYTPQLVTGVWIGNDNYAPMRNIWGSTGCLPIWAQFMRKGIEVYKKEHQPKPKPEPRSEFTERRRDRDQEETKPAMEPQSEDQQSQPEAVVTICSESGRLANQQCPTTYQVSASPATASLGHCTIHGQRRQPSPPPETHTPPRAQEPVTQPEPRAEYLNVQICADTGRIATIFCPERVTKRFRSDEAPSRVCTAHKPRY